MKKVLSIIVLFMSMTLHAQIINPYEGVDFGTHYRTNLHAHTSESDGYATPDSLARYYASLGYSIVAFTEHDVNYGTLEPTRLWRWLSETPTTVWTNASGDTTSVYYNDVGGYGELYFMIGNELSACDHMNALFTDLGFSTCSGIDYNINAIQTNNGLTFFNHPNMYSHSPEWYNGYFNDYYGISLGIEVFNKNNYYPDNGLWDNINELRSYDELIWGFANDDLHYIPFIGKSFNTMYQGSLTEPELRTSMTNGAFTFTYEPDGMTQESPTLTNVVVSGNIITISYSEGTSVAWYDNTTSVIGTSNSIDVTGLSTNFVRAVITNASGSTYTQPFGVNAFTNITSGIDSTLTTYQGYEISPRTSEIKLLIENSRFTQPTTSGYILQVGDDDYNIVNAENVNGALITGNYLNYTGTPGGGSTHGMIAGYNLNYNIKHNYFNGSFYGVVAEGGYNDGTPMTHTNYVIQGNIFKNCPLPVNITGMDGIKVINNTIYQGMDNVFWPLKVGKSNGTTIPAYSKNITFKNNIFYSVDNDRFFTIEAECDTGFVCDYNIYYCETSINNEPRFNIAGVEYSWDEWRAEGYDIHSVIVDPNFIDLVDFTPTSRLNYGENLGASLNEPLTADASWVVGIAPATTTQDDDWQVGARMTTAESLGNAYYVATNGDDANVGSISSPWGTWQKALNTAMAGDTVYFRGGTWQPTNNADHNILTHYPAGGYGNHGTYESPICFFAYPGETPILDCSLHHPSSAVHTGLKIQDGTYLHFKGLHITNVKSWYISESSEMWVASIMTEDLNNLTLEEIIVSNSGGVGMWLQGADTLTLTNCDVYNCCDSLDLSDPGGDGDGYLISSGSSYGVDNHKVVYMTGCRAWNCSDDGIDLTTSKRFYLSNNWLFNNGQQDSPYFGDGTGIKTSGSDIADVTQRQLHRNVTAFNSGGGIAELNLYAPSAPYMQMYNNTSYKDDIGYRSGISGGDWDYDINGGQVVSANNLIYAPVKYYGSYTESLTALSSDDDPTRWVTSTTDSWRFKNDYWYNEYNPAFTITDTDFTNLDETTIINQLSTSRKADGSLPDITVLKLEDGTDLIDGGTDVGLSYSGLAPDLGAFEYISVTDNLITTTTELTTALASASPGDVIQLSANSFTGDIDFNVDSVSITAASGYAPVFLGNVTVSGDYININNVGFSANITISGCQAVSFNNNTMTGLNTYIYTKPRRGNKGRDWNIDYNTYEGGSFNGRNFNIYKAIYKLDRNSTL